MKNAFLLMATLLLCYSVSAQEEESQSETTLKDLIISSNPAMTLLDNPSIVIDRPGSKKAFITSFNNLVGEGAGLPKNFGLEVTPFWLLKTRESVYGFLRIDKDAKKQKIFPGSRGFNISVASLYRDSGSTQLFNANFISAGMRADLISVRRKDAVPEIIRSVNKILEMQLAFQSSPYFRACADILAGSSTEETEHSSDSGATNVRERYQQCVLEAFEKFKTDKELNKADLLAAQDRLNKLVNLKPVFVFNVGAARSWSFLDNTFSEQHHYRSGLWGTAAFSIPLSERNNSLENLLNNDRYVNIYGIMRYLSEDTTLDYKVFIRQQMIDAGFRIELELNRFALSYEYLKRNNQLESALNTRRSVGILQYKISEQVFLTGSFGRNFGTLDNLVALFGLNWGFGSKNLINTQ